jgi:hypothetical protein
MVPVQRNGTPPTGRSEETERNLELQRKKTVWGELTRWRAVQDAGD